MLLCPQSSPVNSWPPAAARKAAKAAAAAPEDRQRVLGVCRGDSARCGRTRGRCGDSGCPSRPLFPSLGGCGGHWGQQQVRGQTRASPVPPAPRSAHHRPGSLARRGVRSGHPGLSAAGTLEPKLPEDSCPQPWLAVAVERQLLDLPWVAERGEEDAAAGGSDGRRCSPELRRDQQRLKFLLSRCRFPGSTACGFPHRPRGSQFPPSPPGPANT